MHSLFFFFRNMDIGYYRNTATEFTGRREKSMDETKQKIENLHREEFLDKKEISQMYDLDPELVSETIDAIDPSET